jgi:1-acyl-sn-glycerol-3-phosphate acyltransferase
MPQKTSNAEVADRVGIAPSISLKLPEFLTRPLSLPEKFTHQFARHTQSLAWFAIYPIFHLAFKIEIEGKENLEKVPSSVIIVSDHVNFYDSFLYSIIFGPYAKQLPLRFMAVNVFDWPFLNWLNKIGVIPFIYALFSVFIVTVGAGLEKNLIEAKRALAYGQSVVIYPEGGLNRSGELLRFHKGAAALAISTGKDLLPIAIKSIKRKGKRNLIKISIGQTFKIDSAITDYQQGTDVIYRKVSELFTKL